MASVMNIAASFQAHCRFD